MESVLISIQPKWCELIASGKKTIEVRKTKPKLETPFKVYIYQTKESKRRFLDHRFNSQFSGHSNYTDMGKVIGEFVCNEIIVAEYGSYCNIPMNESKLNTWDLLNYANEKTVYGWHISDLVIYDKPKELSKFHKPCEEERNCLNKNFREAGRCLDKCSDCGNSLTRPPQSWCYVERSDNNG